MRIFSDREKEVIAHLLRAYGDTQPVQVNRLLETFFFREEHGRALIIQNQGEYAVFFLKAELFDDREKRDEEVKRFFELLALLNYLDRNNYITIYRHATEKLYYVQDYFDAPRIVNNTLFLNTKGYYSSAPDTIHDSDRNVIYKGVIFRDYRYNLILGAATGALLVSESLAGLLAETGATASQSGEREQIETNKDKEQMNNSTSKIPKERPEAERQKKKRKSLFRYLVWAFLLPAFFAAGAAAYMFYGRIEAHEQRLAYITADYKALTDSLAAEIERIKNAAVPPPPPAVAEKTYYGIDISKFNRGIVSEITLHDSITFVICKATEGITRIDPFFFRNVDSIRAKKYLLGAYHFYRAEDRGTEQADFFWKVISGQGKTDIAPVVDMEQESLPRHRDADTKKLQAEMLACLERLQERSRRVPIIYTNRSFADKYLTDSRFSNYPLWIADYVHHDAPALPKAWKNAGYKIWQKKNSYSIGSHLADLDVFFGKLSELTE